MGLLVVLVLVADASPVAQGAGAPQTHRPLDVSCQSCIVVDDLGRVLWSRAPQTAWPNASTTKMVTALVALERVDLDATATVSTTAGAVGGGGLDLQAGDTLSVHDLLTAMLLSSSNEAAAALAEHVGGDEETFVRAMNNYLRRIGATDTHFENPHGLDATGHHSTAADLALIGAAVLEHPVLASIVGTGSASIQTPRGPVIETNRNLLLDSYEGAIGIKTGRTLGAGNVLVAAARRGRRTLIAVAMRSTDSFADATELLEEGFSRARRLDRPRRTTLLTKGTVVGTVVFDPGGSVAMVADKTVTLNLPPDVPQVHFEVAARRITPPLRQGQSVGRVDVVAGSTTIASAPIVIADAVGETPGSFVPNLLGRVISLVADAVAIVT